MDCEVRYPVHGLTKHSEDIHTQKCSRAEYFKKSDIYSLVAQTQLAPSQSSKQSFGFPSHLGIFASPPNISGRRIRGI